MRIENRILVNSKTSQPMNRLERAFLEEMMTHIFPDAGGAISSGSRESEFASFLRREYAAALAARVDLGLKVGGNG